MIIRYPCAKLHCDTPTNSEDTPDRGGRHLPPPNLHMSKKLSPITVNPCHIKGG